MGDSKPQLNFQLTNLTGDGFPAVNNEPFQMMMDQAVAGGDGTKSYLDHMLKFAALADYLNQTGDSAYTASDGPNGSQQAVATDGTSTLTVNVQLDQDFTTSAAAEDDTPVHGLATVTMALPNPTNIIKIAQFGISLAEIPAGIVVTKQLWQALFNPLISRLTDYVQSSIEEWLAIDVGEDVSALGDTIATTTGEVAAELSEETAEVVVEEVVVAELAVDLTVAAPAFAVLGVLIAVPIIISALNKTFILHLEVNNMTDVDFTWTTPYVDEGTMTAQPATSLIPKMGRATDVFGDETDEPVIYQADYSSMNESGFTGIGFVMNFSPSGYTDQDIAAVISIPWITNNGIWLGDPGKSPNWKSIYNAHNGSSGTEHVNHGNQRFYTTLSIDALSGNNDEYHCVLRIEPL